MSALIYKHTDKCIESVIKKLGKNITLATPLGLGKPVEFLNAIYNYAKEHSDIKLTILTALSLVKPKTSHFLAKRLVNPLLDRIYKGCLTLEYEIDRRAQKLPPNVRVIEFFMTPGVYINNARAQKDYICSNYTHIVRDIGRYDVNLVCQLVAKHPKQTKYSISCNTDLTHELLEFLNIKKSSQKPLLIGEVNNQLPYMYGDTAELSEKKFDMILNTENNSTLFSLPRPHVTEQDFMIGVYGSTLLKDDGCLQIGIGGFSEALTANIILRHNKNKTYLNFLKHAQVLDKFKEIIKNFGETERFKKGLCASTEMLVDGFLDLYKNNILIKKMYDDSAAQKSANKNKNPKNLKNGHIVHAGFFIGSQHMYQTLRDMPKDEKKLFDMRSVKQTNQIYNNEEIDSLQRQHARFFNSSIRVTLLGAVVSDTLERAQVVSGVGGQYNFVAMAHELPGAHSIICCKSTYTKAGQVHCNIVWDHETITIPRHLKDIVITEYGIADLRGKTDEEVIKSMLNITDSRFQKKLLKEAKEFGKIDKDYNIPTEFQNNLPQTISQTIHTFKEAQVYKRYPFNSELTADEMECEKALSYLNTQTKRQILSLFFKGLFIGSNKYKKLLKRMKLESIKGLKEFFYRAIFKAALSKNTMH